MAPFTPKRPDGRSYRTVVVDMLKEQDYGSVWTYRQIAGETGLSLTKRHAIQATVREANKILLKFHKRGLQNVANTGYRIIEAREHVMLANGHQSKADKAMGRAIQFYTGADLSRMTETERKLHHGQHMLAEAIYASHQHLDKRLKRVEDLLKGTETINQS